MRKVLFGLIVALSCLIQSVPVGAYWQSVPQVSIGAAGYIANAVDFDGTNDWMLRGGTLTSLGNSKSGIVSAWVRLDGGDNDHRAIISGIFGFESIFIFNRDNNNKFFIGAQNAALTDILLFKTSASYTAGATWYNVLASWDLAAGVTHLYINNISDKAASPTVTDDTVSYTSSTNWAIGRRPDPSGTDIFNGCLAEVYFAPGQFLDFSNSANRAKFIAAGKPVDLGATGSLPTGTAPLVYQKGTAATFGTNSGTGGNFTITGTLDTCSTSPSD